MRRALTFATALAVGFALSLPPAVGAFSGTSRCLGLFVQTATVELGPGYWSPGSHTLSVWYHDPLFGYDGYGGPGTFAVSEAADVYPGQVRVDQEGLFRGYDPLLDQTINPAQDTVLWAAWAAPMTEIPMQLLKEDVAAGATILFQVDGGDWFEGHLGPYMASCANGLLGGTNEIPLYHRTWGPSA